MMCGNCKLLECECYIKPNVLSKMIVENVGLISVQETYLTIVYICKMCNKIIIIYICWVKSNITRP